MKFLFQLRNKSFWLLDALKGNPVKNHLKEIEFCIENSTSDRVAKIKNAHMKRLFEHASETTPFYYPYKTAEHLSDFPIIKKTTIQDNFEQFQSSMFKDKDNFKASTSGSTGLPFFLYQDLEKRNRNHADVIYYTKKSGFKVGQKLYMLKVWGDKLQKGKLKRWLQNIIPLEISRLSETRIESFLNLIKSDKQSKKILLGHASAFETISQYLDENKIYLNDLNIASTIAYAEYLNSYTKITLGKLLNTTVLSRYSNEELGIIAQQTLNSPNKFVLNHASYCIEILNLENDKPAKQGEFGRIVVTDLFNYAMPIIRYDTGDVAKLGTSENGVIELEQIEGRKMDIIYDSNGNMLSSFIIRPKFFKYFYLLKQYQFIQQDEKNYEVKLNLRENRFEFENELIADIKSDFGEDANIKITYVDEIPPLSSGKRRQVINNYKKT